MEERILISDHADEDQIIELINLTSEQFIPSLRERVGIDGYYHYLKGRNEEYIEKKYGKNTPLPNNSIILTVKNNKNEILGAISFFKHFEPFAGSYIVAILVHPSKQNNGVGSKLFEAALKKLKENGVKKISVTTWSTNKASQKIFEKNGFRLNKTIVDERAPNINGLYYELKLN